MLNAIDIAVFCGYLVVLLIIGFVAGGRPQKTSEDYFLAGRRLPWYVVGASFIGNNISTEHFIGMIGVAYVYGICVAHWEWANVFTFSVLIWLFIPFLLRSRVFTAPEFLERRFNPTCRLFFAVLTVAANITAFLAAVLYAAALGLKAMFQWPDTLTVPLGPLSFEVSTIVVGVVAMGVLAGSYAVYGGLSSVAWTDLFHVAFMVVGGLLVTLSGLSFLGEGQGIIAGWKTMVARNLGQAPAWAEAIARAAPGVVQQASYNRLALVQPATHGLMPWPALVFGWIAVGIWYNCINQFMVQGVMGAKDAWHARMGIVFAGFLKIFLPLIVVIPGLIYFAMEPSLLRAELFDGALGPPLRQQIDQGYAVMAVRLLHVGVRGLLMAAIFGAVLSTIDSVLNSTATILSLDIYRKFIRPEVSDRSLVRMGRWITAVVLVIAMGLAPFIQRLGQGVFVYIQNLYAYFAPPFAAVFLLGILWKRATAKAATITIPAGIAFGFFLEFVVFKYWIRQGTAFTLRSVYNWAFCMVLMVVVSLVSAPPPPEKTGDDLTIDWRHITAFKGLGRPWYRNLALWYALFVAGIIACYVTFCGLFLR